MLDSRYHCTKSGSAWFPMASSPRFFGKGYKKITGPLCGKNLSGPRKKQKKRQTYAKKAAVYTCGYTSFHNTIGTCMRAVVAFRSDLRNFPSVCRLPEVSLYHRRHLPLRIRRACCRSHLIFTGPPRISSPRVGPWCVCMCVRIGTLYLSLFHKTNGERDRERINMVQTNWRPSV